MKVKVAVIVATYNSKKYLEECIMSIIGQTYSDWELIIIDGGSTDGTIEIIKNYESYVKYWISEKDDGIYDAWNKGISLTSSDWICFVGSDDVLYPDALEDYSNHIKAHPIGDVLEFVSSNIDLVDENLNLLETVGAPWQWDKFKVSMLTWHVGCFHSRKLFEKYGLYDTSYKISGDYELLLRPGNKLATSYFNKTTAKMRNGGVSSKKLFMASKETYRAKVKNHVISTMKGYFLVLVDNIRLRFRK